jgi:RNA polymerase primary sigma factor
MPISLQLQIKELRELGDQIKIAPNHVRKKQMSACESLVEEIECDKVYPLDYVVFRLTGYRIDSENQPMLPGEPLKSDLVSLVAIISRTLILSPENMLTVEEVAALFKVSKRTISRLRKDGLIFHWIVEIDGRRRIGCNKQTAEHFLATHQERLRSAICFSQLSLQEQNTIMREAESFQGSNLSLNAIARELAKKNQRGVETIRLILKNNDRVQKVYKHVPPLDQKDIRLIQRAIRLGVRWRTIQNRFQRTIPAIRKALLRVRSLDLYGDEIPFVTLSSFSRKDVEEVVLGVDVVTETPPIALVLDVDDLLQPISLTDKDELSLVSAMHLLSSRTKLAISTLQYAPTIREIDRIETDLRWIFVLRQQLVLSAMPAGLAVFVQHVERPLSELPIQQSLEIVRRTLATIWDIVATIDPSRGQKVSRVVVAQIDRMLSIEQSLARPRRASANRQSVKLFFPSNDVVSWARLLPQIRPCAVPSNVRQMYEMRFGWKGNPKTIVEIASLLGCSEVSVTRALRRW